MIKILSETECLPGTERRKIYLYDESGDAIMTDGEIYESQEESDNRVLMEELLEEERIAKLKEKKNSRRRSPRLRNPYDTEPPSDSESD